MTTRVTKKFGFEAAHRLRKHGGLCRNLHGHSYKGEVTVSGPIWKDTGMVCDFSFLSKIIKMIVDGEEGSPAVPLDHSVMLNCEDKELSTVCEQMEFRVFSMVDEPTAENIANTIADRILDHLPDNLYLEKVRIWETENSYAEWTRENEEV